jgi:DnaK suppressor protein
MGSISLPNLTLLKRVPDHRAYRKNAIGCHESEAHMKPLELDRYQKLLGQRRRQLSEFVGDRLHRHGLQVHDDAGLPRRDEDTDDDAAASTMREADLSGLERAARELALVDAAIERMSEGHYGVCVECGEAIPAQRLAAYPEAARCAECQGAHERAGLQRRRQTA